MRTLAKGLAGSSLTAGIALSLNETANDANKTANKIEDSFNGAGTRIKDQFGKIYDEVPASFEKNLSGIKPLFDDITKKQDEVVTKTQEIIDADKEWEAQAMARIDKDVDASQKAIKSLEDSTKGVNKKTFDNSIANLNSEIKKNPTGGAGGPGGVGGNATAQGGSGGDGAEGGAGGAGGNATVPTTKMSLDDMVKSILDLIKLIEPKLPQPVLA